MADELHVGQCPVLGLLPPEIKLLGVVTGQLLLARGERGRERLELGLAKVEKQRLEMQKLAAVNGRSLWGKQTRGQTTNQH
eukprot:5223083-Lingulodinium_polyedra.AAC.1